MQISAKNKNDFRCRICVGRRLKKTGFFIIKINGLYNIEVFFLALLKSKTLAKHEIHKK